MQKVHQLIRPAELCQSLGISKATLWRWTKKPDFLQPINIGGRAVAYEADAINDYIESRKAERVQ